MGDVGSEPWLIPAPVDVVGIDHVLGRVDWASDQNLIVLWLNRRQSISVLVNCNLKQDKCSIVKEHTEANGWVDIHTPFFDETGTKMIEIQPLYHQDQRFPHVARFDFNTLVTDDLSPGNSTVTEILGWDQDSDTVFFIASPGEIPWQRQLWASSRGIVRCISCKEPSCHYTTAMFSLGASFGIVSCSASNLPPKIFLYHCDVSKLGTILLTVLFIDFVITPSSNSICLFQNDRFTLVKDNAKLGEKLSHYKLPMNLFSVLPLEEDVVAHVKLMLPPYMEKGRQYPMVVRVYAGPATSRVKDSYDLGKSLSYSTNLCKKRVQITIR